MTDKSLYPNGVEVDQEALEFTETSKTANARDAADDVGLSDEVVSGLVLTLNSGDNSLLDISAGFGYAANGARIDVVDTQTGISLSDYTDTIVNNVCLMYDEVASQPKPHETDGTTRNTRSSASYRIVVLTDAELAALPLTFDDDLTVNAQDRCLNIGTVLGNGTTAGVANSLSSAEITQETQYLSPRGGLKLGEEFVTSTDGATKPQVVLAAATGLAADTKTLLFEVRTGDVFYRLYHDQDNAALELTRNAEYQQGTGSSYQTDATGDAHRLRIGLAGNSNILESMAQESASGTFSFTGTVGFMTLGDGSSTGDVLKLISAAAADTSDIASLLFSSSQAVASNDKSLFMEGVREPLVGTGPRFRFYGADSNQAATTSPSYEITLNAAFDDGSGNYTADDTTADAWQLELNAEGWLARRKSTTTTPWSAWDSTGGILWQTSNGNVTLPNTTINDTLTVIDSVDVGSGNFTVDASGNLVAAGTADLNSTLDVTGVTTITNSVTCTALELNGTNAPAAGDPGVLYRDMVVQARGDFSITNTTVTGAGGNVNLTHGGTITGGDTTIVISFAGGGIGASSDYQVWITDRTGLVANHGGWRETSKNSSGFTLQHTNNDVSPGARTLTDGSTYAFSVVVVGGF